MLTRWMLALVLSMAMLPALAQDAPPPGAIWNYGVDPLWASAQGQQCLNTQLPARPNSNFAANALVEGDFYVFVGNPPVAMLWPQPEDGLAAKLLVCYFPGWLNSSYCPAVMFTGSYPDHRSMVLEVYLCSNPLQPNWTFTLPLKRVAFYVPPIMGSGFEP